MFSILLSIGQVCFAFVFFSFHFLLKGFERMYSIEKTWYSKSHPAKKVDLSLLHIISSYCHIVSLSDVFWQFRSLGGNPQESQTASWDVTGSLYAHGLLIAIYWQWLTGTCWDALSNHGPDFRWRNCGDGQVSNIYKPIKWQVATAKMHPAFKLFLHKVSFSGSIQPSSFFFSGDLRKVQDK